MEECKVQPTCPVYALLGHCGSDQTNEEFAEMVETLATNEIGECFKIPDEIFRILEDEGQEIIRRAMIKYIRDVLHVDCGALLLDGRIVESMVYAVGHARPELLVSEHYGL